MVAWVYYLWALLLVLACGAAWLTSLVTLPGNWFILGFAALFAWLLPLADGRGVSWKTVAVLAGLAVLGEIIEFAAGAAGAAKQGASKRGVALAMVGAVVGSVLGLMVGLPIPILGPFVMALAGGAAGAFLRLFGRSLEGSRPRRANSRRTRRIYGPNLGNRGKTRGGRSHAGNRSVGRALLMIHTGALK